MQKKNFSHIFFDLDGTLVDSAGEITEAINLMCQQFHLEFVSKNEISRLVGKGFPNTVKQVLLSRVKHKSDHYFDKALTIALSAYQDNIGSKSILYDGVLRTLKFIKKLGISMSVVTNKEKKCALKILEALKIKPFFNLVIGAGCTKYYKPHPQPLKVAMDITHAIINSSLMVGDSENDFLCAKQVGVKCVLVSYGYRESSKLEELHPFALIKNFEDLKELI